MIPAFRAARRAFTEEIAPLYHASDADTSRVRAALLDAVTRLTPYAMLSNIGSGAAILWCFKAELTTAMWAWWWVLLFISLSTGWNWWQRRKLHRAQRSSYSMRKSTMHAAILAGIWALLPALRFAEASSAQQLVIVTVVTGMLSAGAFVLSPLPLASVVWTGILALASVIALWRSTESAMFVVMILISLYAPMIIVGALSASRKHIAALRSSLQNERQQHMVAVLLHDFEQSAEDALWQTGADGFLSHYSPRLAQLLGQDEQLLHLQPFLSLLKDQVHNGFAELRLALNTGKPFRELQLEIQQDGVTRYLAINGKRLLDEEGRTLGWRGTLSDISERIAAQSKLQELAHSDSLTGLANRHTLRKALAQALLRQHSFALLAIDLDHFKSINDNLGHTAGDEVLKTVARRLIDNCRPGDLIARLGGDEFAILLDRAVLPAETTALAERIIAALSQPIEVEHRRMRIGASVGGSFSTASDFDVDELLGRADMALYAAKEMGRGRYAEYADDMGQRSRRRVCIEQGLGQAISQSQLSLQWQAKIDIASWQIVGVEALLRWRHPELGTVEPGEFISVAEHAGLINDIGQWALDNACRAATGPLRGLRVSVNVSPMQLRDEGYVARVRQTLNAAGLEPCMLELEITESVFIGDVDGVFERLHELRALGLQIALDDFGTGYSSLAYLRRFPFDTLKIDRAFIHEVLTRSDVLAIVHTIVQMAGTLGMRTLCEGVESAEQLDAVSRVGCHEIQGYLSSPPCSLEAFVALRANWQPHTACAP